MKRIKTKLMRLKNRRVRLWVDPDTGLFHLFYRKLINRAERDVWDNRIVLTQEAAEATVILLLDVLAKMPSAGVLTLGGQPIEKKGQRPDEM